MRSEIFALPLLALARGVLASPCLPPLSSSSLSGTTTASSETESTASVESSTASVTESTTATTSFALSTASTESTTVLTTTRSTTASASEPSTTSATLYSASTESTITSAIQSTTTSAEPEPEETNLIFYVGQQSGTYEHSDNALDEYWGIYQTIDNTRLELGGRYMVTIRIRVPDDSCSDITLAPSIGGGGWIALSSSVINVGNAVNNWHEVRALFRYNLQWMINNEPGVAIISTCESVSFLVDEASMVKYVADERLVYKKCVECVYWG
ncbi:hypothetical protein LRP88_12174 [Fusarium phalaenopsidis]